MWPVSSESSCSPALNVHIKFLVLKGLMVLHFFDCFVMVLNSLSWIVLCCCVFCKLFISESLSEDHKVLP